MEEELIAQRDAAIAVSKEIQRQTQEQLERCETRALNAERLRALFEAQLRDLESEWKTHQENVMHIVYLSLFCGLVGAFAAWCLGLVAALVAQQPILGLLLVIPGMAIGTILGLAIAQTQAKMEERRRAKRNQRRTSRNVNEIQAAFRTSDVTLEEMEEKNKISMAARGYGYIEHVWTASKGVAVSLWRSKGRLPGLSQSLKKKKT